MVRRAARVDGNQNQIVSFLRSIGCSVQSIAAVGKGCPDILVGFRGKNYLMEIKAEKGKLLKDQTLWHQDWRGQVAVARTILDVIDIMETKKNGL